MNRLLFTLTVLVLMAVPAVALECYTCIGSEDDCDKSKMEDNKAIYLRACRSGEVCIKMWVKEKGNDARVESGCGLQSKCDSAKVICDEAKKHETDDQCEVACCSDDRCNAGSSFTFNIILLAVCTFLGLELLK